MSRPTQSTGCWPLDRYSSSNLVKGGVGNIEGFHLRWSVNHCREELRHFVVSFAVVSFRAFRPVSQTDPERFRSGWSNEGDFVLEPFLFSKQGNDFLLQPLGKLRNAVGLQMHIYSACKHLSLLGIAGQGVIQVN